MEDVPPAEVSFPGRALLVDGVEWWAEELGRTRTGRRDDPGGGLTLVGFRRGGAEGEGFTHEALLPADGLAALGEDALVEALADAGPFRGVRDEPRPFFGAAGKSGRGGGRTRPTPPGTRSGRGRTSD